MIKRWIEIQTDKNNWLLDMEFLLSTYECSWGTECKGINPERPDLGCCANGAYLDEKDIELVKSKIPMLTTWQRSYVGDKWLEKVKEKGRFFSKNSGEHKTALQDPKNDVSGCVFANDPDYSHGGGCALHLEAIKRGENPLNWKPSICWQMPLMVDEPEDLNVKVLRMFEWTTEDYPWFCGQDEVSWVGQNPLYQTMSEELEELMNQHNDPMAYTILKDVCDQAFKQSAQWRGDRDFVKPVPVTIRS